MRPPLPPPKYPESRGVLHLTLTRIVNKIFFFFKKNYLFIYLWLCWVFVSVQGLSLVAASGGDSSSWCMGLSLLRPLLLRSTGSRRAGSAIVAHGPSRSAACGIFPDQGSNPSPALAGRFSTTAPPGKPCHFLYEKFLSCKLACLSLIDILISASLS